MADTCYAPVFSGQRNAWVCFFLAIIFALVIIALIIGTLFFCLFIPSCMCLIKQYQYRIKHCAEGNQNPNVPI